MSVMQCISVLIWNGAINITYTLYCALWDPPGPANDDGDVNIIWFCGELRRKQVFSALFLSYLIDIEMLVTMDNSSLLAWCARTIRIIDKVLMHSGNLLLFAVRVVCLRSNGTLIHATTTTKKKKISMGSYRWFFAIYWHHGDCVRLRPTMVVDYRCVVYATVVINFRHIRQI